MSLPQNIFDEAVEVFGRRFLFVYADPSGRYGICSNCGNTVGYDEQPLPSKHGGDRFRQAACPHCMSVLEVRRGWYGKSSLKDRFYLQAWEVIDYNTVKLHEAIIALDGRTDTADEAGAWESETCYDQRCTTVTPGGSAAAMRPCTALMPAGSVDISSLQGVKSSASASSSAL